MEAQNSYLSDNSDFIIFSCNIKWDGQEKIEFLNYYDICKSKAFTFYINYSEQKIYLCICIDIYGSAFFGNKCYEKPNALIITEIDPTLIFINILYLSFQKSPTFQSLDNHFANYCEKLSELKRDFEVKEDYLESCHKVLNFLKDYFLKHPESVNQISEKTFIPYTEETYYKFNLSKIINFLNSKVSNTTKDSELKNMISIICEFLCKDLQKEFTLFKSIYKN
jgi:hypothetical protein